MALPHVRITSLFSLVLLLALAQTAGARIGSEADWPRQIEVPKGTIVIHQPQLEMFDGLALKARAAIAVTPRGERKPVFGAVWFEARLLTDRDQRLATIQEIKVPRVRFAGSTPEQERRLTAFLEEEIPKWELRLSLDRLLQGMRPANQEIMAGERLLATPPKIIVSQEPAVLITITGGASLKPIEGLKLMRVVNSPFQIFFDPESKKYFINGGNAWFTTQNLKSDWTIEVAGPPELEQLYDVRGAAPGQRKIDELPPRVIVSSEPAELIVFAGAPQFAPLVGEELSYAVNTASNVFLESKTGQIYVVLAGRWFRGASLQGPWAPVMADALPACFAAIPAASPQGGVLAHIAGTEAAQEAVVNSQIPQTAVILRKGAGLQVTYDGNPLFEPVAGLGLSYAVNSPFAIVEVNQRYYACHHAIWYESDAPQGPWRICAATPEGIEKIPPTCPLYNVKFVRVYGSTPDLVYVGYTPGYLGSYVVLGAAVYGTGQTYQDWSGAQYLARPLTWGLGARYDAAWGGWGLAADYSSPGGCFKIIPGSLDGGQNRIRRWSMAGWWGAGGYRDYEDMAGVLKRNSIQPRIAARPKQNVYNLYESTNRAVSLQQPSGGATTYIAKVAAPAPGKKDDLYIDRDGAVYRRTAKGWETREVADWVETRQAGAANLAKLDEERRARERGLEREQQY